MHENEEEAEVKLRERALKKKIGLAREIITDWKAVMTEKKEKKDGIEEECEWTLELVEKIGGRSDFDVKERDELIEKTVWTRKEGIRLMTEREIKFRQRAGKRKKMKAKMRADLRMEIKLREEEEKERRLEEETEGRKRKKEERERRLGEESEVRRRISKEREDRERRQRSEKF